MIGVYYFKCVPEQKYYVSSSLDVKKAVRKERRKLDFGHHPNKKLQDDWIKWGSVNFDVVLYKKTIHSKQIMQLEYNAANELRALEKGYNNVSKYQKLFPDQKEIEETLKEPIEQQEIIVEEKKPEKANPTKFKKKLDYDAIEELMSAGNGVKKISKMLDYKEPSVKAAMRKIKIKLADNDK